MKWFIIACVVMIVGLVWLGASVFNAREAHFEEWRPMKTTQSRTYPVTTYVMSGKVMIPITTIHTDYWWVCECDKGGHWR